MECVYLKFVFTLIVLVIPIVSVESSGCIYLVIYSINLYSMCLKMRNRKIGVYFNVPLMYIQSVNLRYFLL